MRPVSIFTALFAIGFGVGNINSSVLLAEDTFAAYAAKGVPRNVAELWRDYDARREPLKVRIVRQWKTDGIVTRYVTFHVGTFRGSEARIAAYYSFPENGSRIPAFVWSHGGGQRADRGRGSYFARQGYATLDINWLGRPLESGIEENTDWGSVDPTQGPRFYAAALRQNWKRNLLPDEFTIDPVPSPRNSNWFLLVVAARRAITFLEQQPEVDADRIGLSGYSMGGMITMMAAIDPRIRAAVPFVGGSGFKYVDFPGGIDGSSIRNHFQNLDLYRRTVDASAYWPLVRCPVLFISSSNDFHSTFERIYQSLDLLPHSDWRVSMNIHQNHGPGPEQWVMLNQWFDHYLKGSAPDIVSTPPTMFSVRNGKATFRVTPHEPKRLVDTEIYYSHDPNSRTRFWIRAEALSDDGTWTAEFPVHVHLPLYAFAICRYRLQTPVTLERGETASFTLNSREHVVIPDRVNLEELDRLPKTRRVFEDFRNGIQDWSSRDGRSIKTYKFQSPDLDRAADQRLVLAIDPRGRQLSVRLNLDSKFLKQSDNLGSFTLARTVSGKGTRDMVIAAEDFQSSGSKPLEWSKVATLEISIVDMQTRERLDLTSGSDDAVLQEVRLERE